jgi:oligopeptide transport system substrate-binding protein
VNKATGVAHSAASGLKAYGSLMRTSVNLETRNSAAMAISKPANRIRAGIFNKNWSAVRLVLFGVLLGTWLTNPASAADNKSTLRRGTANELRSLDPQAVIGGSGGALLYELFEGLVTEDQHGKLVPGVSESWSRSEDGLTYTFKLRQELRWSDGVPITAEDFVYSWRRVVNPENALRGAGTLFPVKNAVAITRGEKAPESLGVKARDALTLEVSLEGPAPYFTDILAGFPTAPVPRHVVEKYGSSWTKPGNIVGNGAYILDKWVPNTYYRLTRNPNFREASQVSIEEVLYYPIPDRNTGEKRFRAGELDIVLNIPPNRLAWLKENMPDELHTTSALGIRYLIINTKRPQFADVRVRKALSIALDREVIATRILKDGSQAAYNLVPPAMPRYGQNPAPFKSQPYPQRLAEAKKLLAAAGFSSSKPLRFTLDYQNLEDARRVAVALQAMWRSIGADVQLTTTGFENKDTSMRNGDFDVSWFSFYAPYSDATAFLYLLEANNARNYSQYSNPEFDEMLRAANRMYDPVERAAYLKKAEQLALSAYPVIPLFIPSRNYLVGKRVQGWDDAMDSHMARYLSIKD